ncbi:hypothetical protein EDD27_1216 [Nonomuraea polychroma]|uniref:Uncharacterized protein n=1 Tax=Nonomuraea polychroma TaxID=46176 RepID=A0A438M067_9ACTN|nr:hypothetical protein [Nonomuraea polychroma]RVX38888.1 hypothetical protein EDD27_1216 [Nonomuraea polychroma]
MSETTEPRLLGSQISLFDHALRLHRQSPDAPLARDGEPYPDEDLHRSSAEPPEDRRLEGMDVAVVLDAHFARADAAPAELADAFHGLYIPIHHNEHIAAAALRADLRRVRRTGRWLVRHGTDRCAVTVGLALLATDWAEEDIELIQTIGLLSGHFGPLAAKALRRKLGGEALLWLAQRVAGWGRVYVVEELCQWGVSDAARAWLLRHSCDGDFLNGYFAGKVATAAHLHEAITGLDVDDDLIDNTSRMLNIMAQCSGMGMTLERYPPARVVLEAHVGHLARQAPATGRYVNAAAIADHLASKAPEQIGCAPEHRDHLVRSYLAVLDREEWCQAVRADLHRNEHFYAWFADNVAARLRLRAFTGGET